MSEEITQPANNIPSPRRRGRPPKNTAIVKRVADELKTKVHKSPRPHAKVPVLQAVQIRAQQIYNDQVICLVQGIPEPCVMTFQLFATLVLENGYDKKNGMFANVIIKDSVIRHA